MARQVGRWSVLLCVAAVVMFIPLFSAGGAEDSRQPDVVYVTTPHVVVAAMLQMAQVQSSDLVYDLGSGDGRIVIAAARDHGARGVGIEIDAELVEQSRRNAAEAGVADRVRFDRQDLFETDVSEASVVTLYLLPDLNLRLRPVLFQQLRPGSRVVSHAFHMEDWEPDEQTSIGRNEIFSWIIPANLSGRWEWRDAERGGELYQLDLEQRFQRLQGHLRNDSGLFPISWAVVRGEHLLILFDDGIDDSGRPAVFEGKISGESLRGSLTRADDEPQSWMARREAGSQRPLKADW